MPTTQYDLILRNGTLYDGSGSPGVLGDVASNGQTIAAVGHLGQASGQREIDVASLAIFDPATIQDRATCTQLHQYSTSV